MTQIGLGVHAIQLGRTRDSSTQLASKKSVAPREKRWNANETSKPTMISEELMEGGPKIREFDSFHLHHKSHKSWYSNSGCLTFHQDRKAWNTRRFLCKMSFLCDNFVTGWIAFSSFRSSYSHAQDAKQTPNSGTWKKMVSTASRPWVAASSGSTFNQSPCFSAGKNRIIKNYLCTNDKGRFQNRNHKQRGYYTTNPNNAV